MGVTPAECQLLQATFQGVAGGNPITHLVIAKDTEASVVNRRETEDGEEATSHVKRTEKQEIFRLTRMYGEKIVQKLFPGLNPRLPETFEEAGYVEGAMFQAPAQSDKGKGNPMGPNSLEDFVMMTGPSISEPALT